MTIQSCSSTTLLACLLFGDDLFKSSFCLHSSHNDNILLAELLIKMIFMETHKLQSLRLHRCLGSILFLLQILPLRVSSSVYTLPDKYFVNCGSAASASDQTDRNFTGDSSGSVTFTKEGSNAVEAGDNSATVPSIYQTARLFNKKSYYEFSISTNGTYVVRLHFFAFSSPADLSRAAFNVSASGFLLLNISPNGSRINSSHNSPLEEFFIYITADMFRIYFTPHDSSFAFINAIEVFIAPDNLLPANVNHTTNSQNVALQSTPLQIVYRINVGGENLTPQNDTLRRYWIPDDGFLFIPSTASNESTPASPNYMDENGTSVGFSTKFIAPNHVYNSAKKLKVNVSGPSNLFNMTWSFSVNRDRTYFLRFHFCDINSQLLNSSFFDLYINGNFRKEVNTYPYAVAWEVPFYMDFVVDSVDTGHINISIGRNSGNSDVVPFLNGLEIMEITTEKLFDTMPGNGSKISVLVIVGPVLGGVAIICISIVVFCLVTSRKKHESEKTSDWAPIPAHRGGSSHSKGTKGSISSLNLRLKISFSEILFATKNFNAKMRIGRGGFGYVYKGILRNGVKVAVKRSEPGSGQGLPEFQTEIIVLSKIRHKHLVSLIGYCDERSEMILVYEYMEKGTLRDHLYNSTLPSLSWKQRLEICIGSARGLHYLHKGSSGGFIHRDIKSTNILLDENLVAKVADFGLSRIGPSDQTHVVTGVKGTFGYLDPDYFRTEQLTEKSDVYSFGVVLLEVLCARPAIDSSLPRDQVNLAEWFIFNMSNGTLEDMIDPSIKNQINSSSLRKFSETAEKCLQEYGIDRPTMADVLWDLEYALQLQQSVIGTQPQDESIVDDSAVLALPNVQRFPSICMSVLEDDTTFVKEDSSSAAGSEIFSQLNMDGAR